MTPTSGRLRSHSDARPPAPPRTQIGPYQLITKIGEGGMGTVWLTKLPGPAGFNKLAVVKELKADLKGSRPLVEMFLNEARLAARLTHPNVIHTYGANDDRGRLYIVMEYLDGQPWSRARQALWANGTLPVAMHLKVLVDTLSGLHHAHELCDYDGTPLEVVHRDISPQNVFVTYDGLVKVVDFGVARAVNSHEDSDIFVGKLAYTAPEQLNGGKVDRRADLFAVGVMLWEALTEQRLADGQERSEAIRRRTTERAPSILEVAPNVPLALAQICDRALAMNPDERYASAAEFRDAILAYQDETSQFIDSSQLGSSIASAFHDEKKTIEGLIEKHLMHSGSGAPEILSAPEDLIDTQRSPLGRDPNTLRADLSELVSMTRAELDLPRRDSLRVRAVELAQRPLVMIFTTLGLLVAVLLIWRLVRVPEDGVVSIPLPPAPAVADVAPSMPTTTESITGSALPAPTPVPAVDAIDPAQQAAPRAVTARRRARALPELPAPPVAAQPTEAIMIVEPREVPAAEPGSVDFDTRITPDVAPRKIDEEDPY